MLCNYYARMLFFLYLQVELLDLFGRRIISENNVLVRCIISNSKLSARLIGTSVIPLRNGFASFDSTQQNLFRGCKVGE